MSSDRIIQIRKLFLLPTAYCLLSISLTGCATATITAPQPPKGLPGVYHRVQKGQTIWRVAKAYNVEIERILQLNRLTDSSIVYEGQRIFIPGASIEIENLALETDFKDKGGDFIWPVRGKVITFFGMKRDGVTNKGISIQANRGKGILAARSGKVAFSCEELGSYGKIIIIDHLDGYSTVYAHNSDNLVKLNQLVKQGQLIARAGSSGRINSPELYFEIRKGHKPQNPFFYLP